MVQTDVSGGGSYTLTFGKVAGTLSLSPSVPASSTLAVEAQMSTATTSWQLIADIAMSNFLHAPAHPLATFATRSLRAVPAADGGDAAPNLEVYADFTLHGTKKTVVVPGRLDIDACRARFRCEFTIQRSTFGTVDEGSYETFVSDDAVVRIVVDVPRRAAPASCGAPQPPPT
jgi:polyisoprenoid-binding protein YceI